MAQASARVPRGKRPLVHHGVELRCTGELEAEARAQGYRLVAGLDEVGRGALCGPVVAGAVVLGDGDWRGLDDSKRLTARQREEMALRIRDAAQSFAIGSASPQEIDRLNILRATQLAMRRALEGLGLLPDFLLVDGHMPLPGVPMPQRAVVKGDALSLSIAAASILAKVERDALMLQCDSQFPGYGLAHNMGYGSDDHREALRRLGPTKIHRRSFHGTERWLF